MPLFTLISLMIGIFGATISAILSIRTFGERWISGKVTEVEQMFAMIVELSRGNIVRYVSHKVRNLIIWSAKIWRISFLVPIVVFSIWAFATAFFVTGSETCTPYFMSGSYDSNNLASSSTVSNEPTITQKKESDHITMPWFLGRTVLWSITLVYVISIAFALLFLVFIRVLLVIIRFAHRTIVEESLKFPPGRRRQPFTPPSTTDDL